MDRLILAASTAAAIATPALARAQETDEELAKQLSNPVAHLISAPLQFNYDEGFGPDHVGRYVSR